MASFTAQLAAVLLAVVVISTVGYLCPVSAVPLQYSIPQRATECLYDKLNAGEQVTLSVFITSGAELKATAIFEGPVAPHDAESGVDVQNFVKQYQMGHRYGSGKKGAEGNIRKERTVDFENDDWDDDDELWDDDDVYDDDDYFDDDDVAERKRQSEKTKSAKERAEERKKRMEEKKKRYEKRRAEKLKKHNRVGEGDPDQKTYKAEVAGWYRSCVRATWYPVSY